MTDRLADFLEPLPLIAVLRGITPEEIPPIGAALASHGFRIIEVRSIRRGPSIPFVVSPTISATLSRRCGDRHRSRRRRRVQAAGGRVIVMPHADPR
jgi:2-dehydro-3-deoxyphosphogalactonate aldolase